MNEYKITYSVNGKTYTTNRVEHTEATAKRAFLKGCKEMDTTAEVLSLELIRSDACATKQQERDALEAIRKMIAELGPQSYLATAFEGCFEDAECNIENDFGDSWKRRCESAERKLDEAKAEAQAKIATLEAELRKAQQGIDELVQKDDERKDAIKRMQAQALSGGPDPGLHQHFNLPWVETAGGQELQELIGFSLRLRRHAVAEWAFLYLLQANHIVADTIICVGIEWAVDVPTAFDQRPVLALNRTEWVIPPIPGRCLHQLRLEPIHTHQLGVGLSREAVPFVFAVVLAAVVGSGPQRPPVPPQDYRPPIPAQVATVPGAAQFLHNDTPSAEGALHLRLGRVLPAVFRFPLVDRPHDRREIPLRGGCLGVSVTVQHHADVLRGVPAFCGQSLHCDFGHVHPSNYVRGPFLRH